LNAPELLPLVYAGRSFRDGVLEPLAGENRQGHPEPEAIAA
jgi:hypothetical protein